MKTNLTILGTYVFVIAIGILAYLLTAKFLAIPPLFIGLGVAILGYLSIKLLKLEDIS